MREIIATETAGASVMPTAPEFPRYLVERGGQRQFVPPQAVGNAIAAGGQLRLLVLDEGYVVRPITAPDYATIARHQA